MTPVIPHSSYINVLYLRLLSLNLSALKGASLRNIAVKVRLKVDEGDVCDLPLIYHASNRKMDLEASSSITHHSKQPKFYEEFKIEIPANLTKFHFLYFTFVHVSFKEKAETAETEPWTWLSLTNDGRLTRGVVDLPVVVDPPPTSLSTLASTEHSAFRCVDKNKPVFKVEVDIVSSVHTGEGHLERFFELTRCLEKAQLPPDWDPDGDDGLWFTGFR